jgi:hypothetical protein
MCDNNRETGRMCDPYSLYHICQSYNNKKQVAHVICIVRTTHADHAGHTTTDSSNVQDDINRPYSRFASWKVFFEIC